jgi:hypothetical protein
MQILKDIIRRIIEEEEMLPVEIGDESVGEISSEDKRTKNTIKSAVNATSVKDSFITFLRSIGWEDKGIKSFLGILQEVDADHQQRLLEYISDRSVALADVADGTKQNANELMSELFDINDPTIATELFGLEWPSTPAVGAGEAFLSFILDQGRRPKGRGEKGDLLYGNSEVEVKGASGRFRGQAGYGTGTAVTDQWEIALDVLNKELNPDYELEEVASDTGWNILGKTNGGHFFSQVSNMVKDRGTPLTKEEKMLISSEFVKGIKRLLLKAEIDESLIAGIIPDNAVFTIDFIKQVHQLLIKEYYEYYKSIEGFDYMALINKKDNSFLIDTADDFGDKLVDYISNKTIRMIVPNFSKAAGAQGSFYGIELK